MGVTRVVHRVRCRKKDDNQIWADVKVVDALSVIGPNGSARLIWTRAKDANPCIIDKTGGGNAKGTPVDCTRLSHMELVTGQEDSSQQIYIEVLDAIAFAPPRKGDPDGVGPQANIEQTGGLPKAAVFGRGPYALFLPEKSASKYVVDKVGLGLAQGSSESASRTEHVCLITESGNTDDKTDEADAIPPQILAWCATLKIDAINFKVPGGNITLMIGKGLQDEQDTTKETTDPTTGEPCPPDNTDPNVYVDFPPDTTGCDVRIPTRSGSTGPLDMGPLWWIDRISGGFPVYVSVYCSADIRGLSGSGDPPHVASVTLSPQAIERGCEIVLDTGGIVPDPYFLYAKLVVIKVPSPTLAETLCTLTVSGTTQESDLPPPDYACGTWSTTFTSVRGPDFFPDAIDPIATWTETLVNVTPDGTTTVVRDDLRYHYRKDDPAEVATVEHLDSTSFESHQALYYHDGFGRLVDTGIPCDSPPTHLVELFTYDNVQVFVHPVKDHVVSDEPSFLWDPTASVKVAGSGNFGGSQTSIWRADLSYRVSAGALNGLTDGSYPFKIKKSLFATSRKEKIIEVYPSEFKGGYLALTYRGGFRLNKKSPTGSMYFLNWDGTPPDFNDGLTLYAGSPPPSVPWVPYNIPF